MAWVVGLVPTEPPRPRARHLRRQRLGRARRRATARPDAGLARRLPGALDRVRRPRPPRRRLRLRARAPRIEAESGRTAAPPAAPAETGRPKPGAASVIAWCGEGMVIAFLIVHLESRGLPAGGMTGAVTRLHRLRDQRDRRPPRHCRPGRPRRGGADRGRGAGHDRRRPRAPWRSPAASPSRRSAGCCSGSASRPCSPRWHCWRPNACTRTSAAAASASSPPSWTRGWRGLDPRRRVGGGDRRPAARSA